MTDTKNKGRELDVLMAQKVLGHPVFHEKTGALREKLPDGQTRPLRSYSVDISAAWEVAAKLGITILPIQGGYFCLVGKETGWESPADFIKFLADENFARAGAAVGPTAPLTICQAAERAVENREATAAAGETRPHDEQPGTPDLH